MDQFGLSIGTRFLKFRWKTFETMYSKMDQVKFVEDNLKKIWSMDEVKFVEESF